MKNAIILHGMPSKEEYFDLNISSPSNSHWLPRIQKQLLVKGYNAQTPELPNPFEPEYVSWKKIFELFPVTSETILIGHSCGAGFLVRWLSENKIRFGKVILVAPWIDLNKELANGFFEFEIDSEMANRSESMHVIFSNDDDDEIISSVEKLKEIKNMQVHEFEKMGHFTSGSMGTNEFPALLDII